MRTITKGFLFLLVLGLGVLLAACNLPGSGDSVPPSPTASGMPDPADPADPTSEPAPAPTDMEGLPGGSDGEPAPTEEAPPPEAALEGRDPCLYGVWTVDNESMAAYLENALNSQGEVDIFAVTDVTGTLQLAFNEAGEMTVNSEDYLIRVSAAFSEQVTMDLEMILEAAGTAEYQADGMYLTNKYADLEVTGAPLDSVLTAVGEGGSTIILEVTPDWFLGRVTEIDGDDTGSGVYTCTNTTLTLQTNTYGAVTMTRQ